MPTEKADYSNSPRATIICYRFWGSCNLISRYFGEHTPGVQRKFNEWNLMFECPSNRSSTLFKGLGWLACLPGGSLLCLFQSSYFPSKCSEQNVTIISSMVIIYPWSSWYLFTNYSELVIAFYSKFPWLVSFRMRFFIFKLDLFISDINPYEGRSFCESSERFITTSPD